MTQQHLEASMHSIYGQGPFAHTQQSISRTRIAAPLARCRPDGTFGQPEGEIVAAPSVDLLTGDRFAALADRLRSLGLAAAAEVAFEGAAGMDFEDESLKEAGGGPFNGQRYRQNMFEQLLKCVAFSAILNTGTFHGSTTEFLANRAGAPVFSCELSERFFHFAQDAARCSQERPAVKLVRSRVAIAPMRFPGFGRFRNSSFENQSAAGIAFTRQSMTGTFSSLSPMAIQQLDTNRRLVVENCNHCLRGLCRKNQPTRGEQRAGRDYLIEADPQRSARCKQ
jgi:hypothetical protein